MVSKKVTLLVITVVGILLAVVLFVFNSPLSPTSSFIAHKCFEITDFYQFNSYDFFSTTNNAYLRVLPDGRATYLVTDINNLIIDYRGGLLDQSQISQLLSLIAEEPSNQGNVAYAMQPTWGSSAKSVVGGKFTIVYDINIHDLLLEIGETLETRELDDGVYLRAIINHYPARSGSDADLTNLNCDQDPLQSFVAAVASEQQLVPFPEDLDAALINRLHNRNVFLARLNRLQSIPFHLVKKSSEDIEEIMTLTDDLEEGVETATSTTQISTEEAEFEQQQSGVSCAPIYSNPVKRTYEDSTDDGRTRWRTFKLLASENISIPGNCSIEHPITIDSNSLQPRLFVESPTLDSVSFTLLAPDGVTIVPQNHCTQYPDKNRCDYYLTSEIISNNRHGEYLLQIQNSTRSNAEMYMQSRSNIPRGSGYYLHTFFNEQSVIYPERLSLNASLDAESASVTGLTVTGTVLTPSGRILDLVLHDDSIKGQYTAAISYTENGIYYAQVTVNNREGLAETTHDGVLSAPPLGNGTFTPPTTKTIPENFTRTKGARTEVAGVQIDDHADGSAVDDCMVLTDNNFRQSGRIDYPGDVDCFQFVPSSTEADLYIRLGFLELGMDPVLILQDNTGNIIGTYSMSDSINSDVGLIVKLPQSELGSERFVFTVQHADTDARTGSYVTAVGPFQPTDVER